MSLVLFTVNNWLCKLDSNHSDAFLCKPKHLGFDNKRRMWDRNEQFRKYNIVIWQFKIKNTTKLSRRSFTMQQDTGPQHTAKITKFIRIKSGLFQTVSPDLNPAKGSVYFTCWRADWSEEPSANYSWKRLHCKLGKASQKKKSRVWWTSLCHRLSAFIACKEFGTKHLSLIQFTLILFQHFGSPLKDVVFRYK